MCISNGTLRAMIDGELTGIELVAAESHLAVCAECRQRTKEINARAGQIQSLFSSLEPSPDQLPSDARFALNQLRSRRRLSSHWLRIFTSSISIPVPIAAAFVILLSILIMLAF